MKKEYKEKSYMVRVTYDDLRVVNSYTEDKGYKTSLELYGELKSRLKVDAYKVELVKIINGNKSVVYTKKKDEQKGDDCRELARNILMNIEKLKREYEYYNAMKSVRDKKESSYVHMIEKIDKTIFESEEEKGLFSLNIISKIKDNSNIRRYEKGQLIGLGDLISKLNDTAIISNLTEYIEKENIKEDMHNINAYEMGILSHKDVRYTDEKDKKKIISTYEKDYENYVDDYKNKTICFFNRLGANKYRKPTKIEFETECNKPEKLIVADITQSEDKIEKEIEENNKIIFDYPSNSMKKIILKQNRNKYKYHKVDTREKRIIFSNQEII